MKKKKIICVILLSSAIIWLLLDGFFYLNFGNTRTSTIHARNSDATVVQFELTHHIQELNIPKDSDAVINGEIVNSGQTLHYLRVYQNEYLKEELLLGDESCFPKISSTGLQGSQTEQYQKHGIAENRFQNKISVR